MAKITDDSGLIETVRIVTNPEANGGEAATLEVEVYDNGDPSNNLYAIGKMTLQSYGGSAVITFPVFNVDDLSHSLLTMAEELTRVAEKHTRHEDK